MNERKEQQRDCFQQIPVRTLFDGRSVFITGASGFIGRVLLEKLLRTYLGIKKIYILLRTKKNVQPRDRLHNQLLNAPIFDKIRQMDAHRTTDKLIEKIEIVCGDIAEANMGINESDLSRMINDESLSIVFHSAATVRFDEPLERSARLNLIATKKVIEFSRKLKNLISLCHVSTAFANCGLTKNEEIEEVLYPMNESPSSVICYAENMNDHLLNILSPHLIGEQPNSYVYTKALAEHLIAEEASDLPVTIIRPSIVTAAWRGPIEGWIDNSNGPTGLCMVYGKGIMRTIHARTEVIADFVPVDLVVNTMIAAAYYTARERKTLPIFSKECSPRPIVPIIKSVADNTGNKLPLPPNYDTDPSTDEGGRVLTNKDVRQLPSLVNGLRTLKHRRSTSSKPRRRSSVNIEGTSIEPKQPLIVHCNSGYLNPMNWGEANERMLKSFMEYPSARLYRYPSGSLRQYRIGYLFSCLFLHLLPGLIVDMCYLLFGKRPLLLEVYSKLHRLMISFSYFTTSNFKFKTKNLKLIGQSLSPHDKEDLYLDIERIDWDEYSRLYVLGIRRHVLKEPDETIESARKHLSRAYYLEVALQIITIISVWFLFISPMMKFIGFI